MDEPRSRELERLVRDYMDMSEKEEARTAHIRDICKIVKDGKC